MSADRCPSCSAAVRADAAWCGQCYASLRPEPAPTPAAPPTEPTSAAEAVTAPPTLLAEPPAVPAQAAVSPEAAAAQLPLPGVVQADPLLAAPVVPAVQAPVVPVAPANWPCGRCKTLVPFDDDVCPNCNARFLDPDLPGVAPTLLDKLPRGQRKSTNAFLIMVVGGLTLMGVFIGLFALLGTIF